MEKNFEFSADSINSISIKTAWPLIEINTESRDNIRLMITGDDISVSTISAKQNAGELIVEQPHFGINKSILQGSWMQILLILPKDYTKPLMISSISGSSIISDYHGDKISIDMVSGDIKLRDTQADKIRIRNVSGNVSAESVKADSLKIRAASGKAKFNNLSVRTLASNYISGDQKFDITNEFESLDFSSISGNIELYQSYASVNVNMRSVASSLIMDNVAQDADAANIALNIVSGKITIANNNK